MNNRIEELRIEAWRYANNYQGDVVMPQLQSFEQKFAELIVKECAKVCRESADSGVVVDAGFDDYDKGCNDGLHEAAVTIEKHFGIE